MLNTYFFNISTQGHMENDGIQKELNMQEINRLVLENAFTPHPVLIKYFLGILPIPSTKKGYPLAEDFLIDLLRCNQFTISLGCLSAKDRTGFISERLMLQHLPIPYQDHPLFRKGIFNSCSPAIKVVTENTPGIEALKIDVRANLRGYHLTDKPGILRGIILAI